MLRPAVSMTVRPDKTMIVGSVINEKRDDIVGPGRSEEKTGGAALVAGGNLIDRCVHFFCITSNDVGAHRSFWGG